MRVSLQLTGLSQQITDSVLEERGFSCKAHLIEAYSLVYENCTDKPAQNEKMLAYFKELLVSHLMAAARVLACRNLIREFNRMHNSYMLYA